MSPFFDAVSTAEASPLGSIAAAATSDIPVAGSTSNINRLPDSSTSMLTSVPPSTVPVAAPAAAVIASSDEQSIVKRATSTTNSTKSTECSSVSDHSCCIRDGNSSDHNGIHGITDSNVVSSAAPASSATPAAAAGVEIVNHSSSNGINSSKVLFIEKSKARAEEYKNLGNKLFKDSLYEQACQAYSKAIELCENLPKQPPAAADNNNDYNKRDDAAYSDCYSDCLHIYLCNRAFCQLKLENFGTLLISKKFINKNFCKKFDC